MKYNIFIIIFIYAFYSNNLCSQVKFYELLDGITHQEINCKINYQIEGSNFNNISSNVLNSNILYLVLSDNDSIMIFSPVDYNCFLLLCDKFQKQFINYPELKLELDSN